MGANKRRDEQIEFVYELSSTNLMSCCYFAFELLLLDTWPSACYQRVDVLSQLYLIVILDSSLHVGFR